MINVSGHRLGTAEVESALVAHEAVAEAAVVPFPHEIKGQGIFAFVVPIADGDWDPARAPGRAQRAGPPGDRADRNARRDPSGAGLPKTRSGKIMRRILRKIAAGEEDQLGDISTLADPSVVEALLKED